MLYAARLAAAHSLPLLGVNRGRLGFLADIANREMLERVDEVLGGRYLEEQRLMLEAEIRGGEQARSAVALNDVVLQKFETGRMLDFETWIDGVYVNTHGGDGIVVATPTGSTAYALSGGDPILHPTMQAMVLVPICPHTLSDRPLVIGDDCEIEVRVLEREGTRSEVICDGRLLAEVTPEERLVIRRGPAPVKLIHPVDYDYYRILRSKLHWGRGNRLPVIGDD
jgi:NAD+ kinase